MGMVRTDKFLNSTYPFDMPNLADTTPIRSVLLGPEGIYVVEIAVPANVGELQGSTVAIQDLGEVVLDLRITEVGHSPPISVFDDPVRALFGQE